MQKQACLLSAIKSAKERVLTCGTIHTKRNFKKFVGRILLAIAWCFPTAHGQNLAQRIQEQVAGQQNSVLRELKKPDLVYQFYSGQNFAPAFFNPEGSLRRQQLMGIISLAGWLCLKEEDYQPKALSRMQVPSPLPAIDSAIEDILLVDAALHFFSDIAGGNSMPSQSYNGLKFQPDDKPILNAFNQSIAANNLAAAVSMLEPQQPEYVAAKQLFRQLYAQIKDPGFSEPKLTNAMPLQKNKSLQKRLQQFGILDAADSVDSGKLVNCIKTAQSLFNLPAEGTLNDATITALNIPMHQRVQALATAINYLRWLNALKLKNTFVIINIPAANLFVYEQGILTLDSRVITGKPSTPTPTLSSRIAEVILYPYWHVPHSIATRELLPKIRRNINFLEDNNFQVLDNQGQMVNPRTIQWQRLNPGNFPYVLRQSAGCDNALGIVKFEFYNPFSVYLHDTPGKTLFLSRKRFYSHGCIRLQKPIELAKILLKKEEATIKALTAQCLKNQRPQILKVEPTIPIIVLYSTAWYDASGNTRFYNDIYKKEQP